MKNINKLNTESFKAGYTNVSNKVSSGITKAKSNISGAASSISKAGSNAVNQTRSGAATLKNNAASVGSSAQQRVDQWADTTGDRIGGLVTSRRSAFTETFKDTVAAFALKGSRVPSRFDGAVAGLKPTTNSGALRKTAYQAASLALAGTKVLTGLAGAFAGVLVGLRRGIAAYRAYTPVKTSYTPFQDALNKKAGKTTVDSHPVSAPSTPESPRASEEAPKGEAA